MKYYFKNRILDWIFCVCLTVSMTFTVCSGFILNDVYSSNAGIVTFFAVVLQILLLLAAYSRRTTGIGVIAGIAVAVFIIAYMQINHPLSDETANSIFVFLLVEVILAVLVFLLTRTRPGILFLLLAGNTLIAGTHFLEFPNPSWSFFLFVAVCVLMFIYRVYMCSVLKADMGKVRIRKYMMQTVVFSIVALLIAGGIFAGVVRPLNPPTQDLKLIRVLKSMDTVKVVGLSKTVTVLNPELSSSQDSDQTEHGNDPGEEESKSDIEQQKEMNIEENEQSENSQSIFREDINENIKQQLSAIRYNLPEKTYYWLIAIPIIIAAIYILRLLFKMLWRKRVRQLSRENAVVNYYRFFLSRLGKAGLKRQDPHTLREYNENAGIQMQAFTVEGCTFSILTQVYEKVLYGRQTVSEDELKQFEAFYDGFYRNLRNQIGKLKYYFMIFRY